MPHWTVEDHLESEILGIEELTVRLVSGEIAVTATDGPPQLRIGNVENRPVEVSFEDGALRISHPHEDGGGRWLRRLGPTKTPRAEVVLAVPPAVRAEIASVSADVVVAGLSEPAKVKTVSGDVTLKDLWERVEARSVSGDLEARGMRGDLTFSTVSGDLSMVDGTCKWLLAKTVSGDITLDLDLQGGGVYAVATVSGDVGLRVPSEPSIEVDAATLSGDLETDWDITWEDRRPGRRRVHATIGSGDARLSVKTVSGDLKIVRRKAAA